MILYQFPEKGIIRICQHIVETDAGTDEDFFHLWKLPELMEQFQIVFVGRPEIFAGLWKKALPAGTDPRGLPV